MDNYNNVNLFKSLIPLIGSLAPKFFNKKRKKLKKVTLSTVAFFNNLATLASYIILPPKSLGKISMVSWFVNQCEEAMFIVNITLAELFMLTIALIGFSFTHVIYKKDTFFVREVIPNFKKLSLVRKILFGSFTIITAIPNKFWVNVKIHFIFVIFISAVIYLLGFVFPQLFFCYFVYLVICFESLLFGLFYEYSEYFKKLTNYALFGNPEEPFARDYFHWFWGNMWKQGLEKLGALAVGVGAVEGKRQLEIGEKNRYADTHTDAADKTTEGFKTPIERADFHKERRAEWVEENGTVTKIAKLLEDSWD